VKLRWLPILAPAVLSLLLSVWVLNGGAPNPVAYVRAEVSAIVVLMGIALSILAGIGLLIFDFVERIHLQSTLEAAADRRRFLHRLDHELKNPLTAILAGLTNLSGARESSDRDASLESVRVQVERLRKLVADLRKLSDLDTIPLERSAVDVGVLLEEAFRAAQDSALAQNLHFSLSVPRAPWPLPAVSGDYDLISLAVYNLLHNALKFTPPGGRVEVRAFEDSSHVSIEVADTGPGIPDDEAPHVWEELFRGVGARGVPGSGLGLALARAIVERHGGKVSMRSRSGQGTVFTVQLPVGEASKR
jgi:two-component system OmpR family sensor kinase